MQPGAALAVRAAAAVVLDVDLDDVAVEPEADGGGRRLRVARDVRERLGDRVVERRLDRGVQALGQPVVQLDGHRAARDQRLHGRDQPAHGEQRGMDPARELAQLGEPGIELAARRRQHRRRVAPLGQRPLRGVQADRRDDAAAAGPRRGDRARSAAGPHRRRR